MARSPQPMGIGIIGNPDIIVKRKFRYTFQIQGFCNNARNLVPEHFVKVAARPSIDLDETVINHLNAKMWLPGKGTWDTLKVTYIDVANAEMQSLWNWLATVYNFTNPVTLTQAEKRDWNATGIVNVYDGCGTLLEAWLLQHCWPKTINFGDMDYASSDEMTIELTIRYSDVVYKSYCPAFTPQSCCNPCGSAFAAQSITLG